MKLKHRRLTAMIGAFALILTAGCGDAKEKETNTGLTPTPIATATVAVTNTPTVTPTSAATPTPTDTPLPTWTPTPTVTSTPTVTPTPTKRLTPTPTGVPTFPCDAYVACYSVSLRNPADVKERIQMIYNGDKVTVTGSSKESGYYNCIYKNEKYLISKQYVSFDKPFEFDYKSFEIVDPKDVVYSYGDMEADIFALAKKYPSLFSYYSAGKSPDNRELYICTVGNPNAHKCIYITGTAHAREYCTSLMLMMQTEYYLKTIETGYFKDVNYKDLLDEICFVLMPMQNPDGVDLCIGGPSAIRNLLMRTKIQSMYDRENAEFLEKYGVYNSNYYRRWKANAQGIDLNRNYPFGWEETNDYPVPSSSGYKGEEPFSATEVQVQVEVQEQLMREKDVIFAISYHATGNDLSWDVGQTGEFRKECERAADALVYVTDYIREMNMMTLDNDVPLAGYTDWLNGEEIIPSITIEILPLKIFLAAEQPEEEEMYMAWVANRQVWAVLGELYYEGERR